MPFDVAKSCGNWIHGENSDNYPQIMAKLGMPVEMFDKVKAIPFPVDSKLEGNVMTSRALFGEKVIVNTFTLGVEGEEEDPFGKKRKITYTMEGEYLVAVYPDHDGNGLHVQTRRHFVDNDTIRVDIKAGDMEGWATSKRC